MCTGPLDSSIPGGTVLGIEMDVGPVLGGSSPRIALQDEHHSPLFSANSATDAFPVVYGLFEGLLQHMTGDYSILFCLFDIHAQLHCLDPRVPYFLYLVSIILEYRPVHQLKQRLDIPSHPYWSDSLVCTIRFTSIRSKTVLCTIRVTSITR